MPLYKLELIVGLSLIILGVISLVFLVLNGAIFSIGVLIPLLFTVVGIYFFYLSFKEPELEE